MQWDEAYKGTPQWDVGHPQPVFQTLIKGGELIMAGLWTSGAAGARTQ